MLSWAEAPIKIARMTLTIKLDGNWSSLQLANSAPPLSVTDSAIAPSARMKQLDLAWPSRVALCARARSGARVSALLRNGGRGRGSPNCYGTGKTLDGELGSGVVCC